MSSIVPRCRSCGFEPGGELADCPVCFGPCGWWCAECREWRPTNACPSCAAMVAVPSVVRLGSFPPGTRVPVRISIRNRAKKTLSLPVESLHPALSLSPRVLHLKPGEYGEVAGLIAIGQLLPGRHVYRVRYGTPTSIETEIEVEVVPPFTRLEFSVPEIVFPNALPGATARRTTTVRNTGNLPVSATVSTTAIWLDALPVRIGLEPGTSTSVTVIAKPRRTDCGIQVGAVRAECGDGHEWELTVRVHLPVPELAAEAVAFGDIRAGHSYYHSLVLRNTGVVRVTCALAGDEPWLSVTPKKVTLVPGKEKEVKLRARIRASQAGPRAANVIAAYEGRELLRIPVTAVCRLPKAILSAIPPQVLGTIANDVAAWGRFHVSNSGDGLLDVSVSTDETWLQVLTKRLKVKPGQVKIVGYRVDSPTMARGSHRATLRVRSNAGEWDVPVSLTVVDPKPELQVAGDLELGRVTAWKEVIANLAVKNAGVGQLAIQAETGSERVVVRPAKLMLASGSSGQFAIVIAVADLDGGQHSCGVQFNSNGGSGRAEVRFRLPVEQIDAPSMIDLGNRAAGRAAGESVRLRNTGLDTVTLAVRCENESLHLATERVSIDPGELVAVPFSWDLPVGELGPMVSKVFVDGRKARHTIAVRAVSRRVELVVDPYLNMLGSIRTGKGRNLSIQVMNRGELTVDIRESHTGGDLEVWLSRLVVKPGETGTMVACVRMNSSLVGQEVRAAVPLGEVASLQFAATVVEPLLWWNLIGVGCVAAVAGGLTYAAQESWTQALWAVLFGVIAASLALFGKRQK